MIKTTARTRTALLVSGALAAHLAPKLAADAQIDLGPVVGDVTRANFRRKRPAILTRLQKATKGKLAMDADLDEVAELLEQLDDVKSEGEDELKAKDESEEDEESEKKDAKDEDPDEKKADAKDEDGDDDEDEDDKKEPPKAKDKGGKDKAKDSMKAKDESEEDKDKKPPAADEDKVDRKAMDAAIARATVTARRQAIAEMHAIQRAKDEVFPYIGAIDGDVDSASEIYKMALDAAVDSGDFDLDLKDVPASAYPALVRLLPKPGAAGQSSNGLAMDAGASKSYAERWSGAERIRQL